MKDFKNWTGFHNAAQQQFLTSSSNWQMARKLNLKRLHPLRCRTGFIVQFLKFSWLTLALATIVHICVNLVPIEMIKTISWSVVSNWDLGGLPSLCYLCGVRIQLWLSTHYKKQIENIACRVRCGSPHFPKWTEKIIEMQNPDGVTIGVRGMLGWLGVMQQWSFFLS